MQLDKQRFSLKDIQVPESIRILLFCIVYGLFITMGIGPANIHGEGWFLVLLGFGGGVVAMSSSKS